MQLFIRSFKQSSSKQLLIGSIKPFSKNRNKYRADNKSVLLKKNKIPQQNKVPKIIKEQISLSDDIQDLRRKQINFHNKFSTIQDAYRNMDSSIEGFFYKREMNLINFNFLLQIIAEKKQVKQAEETIQKMIDLNIQPDSMSYSLLIKACSKQKDVQKAEQYFDKATGLFGHNVHLYNSLMLGYVRTKKGEEVERIFKDMIIKGLKPTLENYTTLITGLFHSWQKNGKNINKCWEYYNQVVCGGDFIADEQLRNMMMRVCSATRDCEKAITIWNSLGYTDYVKTCFTYNSYMQALSSRSDYSYQALEVFHKMIFDGIKPNQNSIVYGLKACTWSGDVKQANDILQIMRQQQIQPNTKIYRQILAIYTSAMQIDKIDPDIKQIYIDDAWRIMDLIIESDRVNSIVLNQMVELYSVQRKADHVEGLVLPLFDKYGIQPDKYTYQYLVSMYHQNDDPIKSINVFKKALKTDNECTFTTLNDILLDSIKLIDVELILVCLDKIKQMNKYPYPGTLKKLGYQKNLPEPIFVKLSEFDIKFGHLKGKVLRETKDNYSA